MYALPGRPLCDGHIRSLGIQEFLQRRTEGKLEQLIPVCVERSAAIFITPDAFLALAESKRQIDHLVEI